MRNPVFWLAVAATVEGVLVLILFVRMARVEKIVRGLLGGWKRGR